MFVTHGEEGDREITRLLVVIVRAMIIAEYGVNPAGIWARCKSRGNEPATSTSLAAVHPRVSGFFLRPWKIDISRRTSLIRRVRKTHKRCHYTQFAGVNYNRLTIVTRGDDAPRFIYASGRMRGN